MKAGALLSHAARNPLRNGRRSAMILVILAASTLTLFVTNMYLAQMYRGMSLGYVYQTGNLQVARRGFWDPKREGELVMERELVERAGEIARGETALVRINAELSVQGLLGTELRSTVVNGMGVEAERAGGYAGYVLVKSGFVLDSGDVEGVIVGEPIADKLGIQAEDYVNIMATAVDGSLNLVSARVAGVVSTGMGQADAYFLAGNLDFVRQLRGTEGAERLLLFLREDAPLDAVAESLAERFAAEGLDLEIRTWEELNPFYFELKGLYDAIFAFIKVIIAVLVLLAVAEIVSMSFFERFRELGTLRAIGTTRGEILAMLLVEVGLYASVGVAVGASLGAGLAALLNGLGLSWTPPGSTNPVPFGFFLRWRYLASPVLIVYCASLVAALVPAIRSARMRVAEELKYE
ncbi:MAG: ABC transporter permease [Spirochaetales bacterium]|nr:ABC transporter permease [Spirochaetales bacterium]